MFKQIRLLTAASLGNILKNSKAIGGSKRKKGLIIGLFIFLGIYIAALSGALVYLIYDQLSLTDETATLRIFIPCLYFVLASALSLITGLFSSQGFLFTSNDFDMLFSLPVSTKAILISKFLVFYGYELIFSIATIGVSNIVYMILDGFTVAGVITTILGITLTPILPMMLGTVIAYGISMLIRSSAHKNMITTILTIIFTAGLLIVVEIAAFSSDSLVDYIIKYSGDLLKSFRDYYFPAGWYVSAFSGEYLYMLLFAAFNLVPLLLLILISINYRSLVSSFRAGGKKVKYTYSESNVKTKGVLLTCFVKEFKKLLSSAQYMMNAFTGIIMMFLGLFTLSSLSEGVPAELSVYILLAEMLLMCTISSTTTCTISLEAKTLWIYKTSPVKENTILVSKAMVNYCVFIPAIIVVSVIAKIMYAFTIPELLLLILLPSVAVLFMSYFGLVINLALPKFDWTNEIYAIKQSSSVLVTMFSTFIFNLSFIGVSVWLAIAYDVAPGLLVGILFLVYLAGYAVTRWICTTWGVRRFRSL